MKKTSLNLFKSVFMLLGLLSLITMYSCDDDDDAKVEDPIASFQYAISETNYLEVTFTNFSTNATSYSWNFGDGSDASVAENPTHTYLEAKDYVVVLTATNNADVSVTYEQSITITDPNAALKLLTGEVSKTWKLFREGVAMSLGTIENPVAHWPGFENDGSRPCLYFHTFTFHADGSYVFDDQGAMWGEWGVFPTEECFEATESNMVNADGDAVTEWLSGTHAFDYDASSSKLTLTGKGAWIGIIKLGPTGEIKVPGESTTCDISITEETGYDLMTVKFVYGADVWTIKYASYNTGTEPEVVTTEAPWGEDLDDITPTEIKITFASRDAADLVVLDTITSNSNIEFGVADPAGGSELVGKFNRTDQQYQEQQFQTAPDKKDIQFDNFTKVTFDVYFPADNDYSTTLTKTVEIGFGDISETKAGWWTAIVNQTVDDTDVTVDTWKSFSFDLTDAKTSTKLDMFYINIGASAHTAEGTFYIRNLIFE